MNACSIANQLRRRTRERPAVRRWLHFALASTLVVIVLSPGWSWGGTRDRKLTAGTGPAYPALAKKLKITGTVKADLFIAPNGTIKRIDARGHPLLVQAVVESVKAWKYEPASTGTINSVIFVFK
ncbi:MAG: energy transducer TonB [Acidobacteriia bacterium]|nr:energy transducer TonB [Terriglobia bacterium]